jgi:protocatechuate 3,4-dioxygenase beta subunit
MDSPIRRLTRREAIAAAGAVGAGAGAYALVRALDPAMEPAGAAECVLAPEQAEGPFYIARSPYRRNVRAGRRGVALDLRLRVVEVSGCDPVRGATVEIWHCDARGRYSAEASNGTSDQSFLRGAQRTDRHGVARFLTIYPGWYPGRAPHIHVKVHVRGNLVHTGQLYFNQATSDAVYRRSPYTSRGPSETKNSQDGIYADGGGRSTLRLRRQGSGYIGRLTMGIRT